MEYTRTGTWNKFKNSLPANLLFLLLALGVGYGTYNMFGTTLSLWNESHDTQKKIEELSKKKAELEAYIAELETKEGVEREAKKYLNLKLPGEQVVVVIPEKEEIKTEEETPFMKIKSFLTSLFSR